MWEREQLSLKRHLSDISFNIQELRVILDELYMNEEFEDDNKWAYERVIYSLDKLNVIRKDLEKLTERVTENNVWIYRSSTTILYCSKYEWQH